MSTQANRPVKCKLCEKKLVSKQALIDHIERMHSESIPKGWSPARYENFIRTGKTEGRCVECHKPTTWNETTGKYNRMCGSEACKKIARERANKNYIGLHGKPYSINNPEQQAKMVYGRKNSGTYTFEDERGKKYTAMYDSSYGLDFLQMIDTFLNWDGSDVIAPSPHTYWYEYEGKKHFYMPDVYLASINLEVELKDGGDNPNKHPKIQAVDKVKEQKKDKVMESIKDQVNYIKICNKDYSGFFALLSKLKAQDECPLPKWESQLEPSLEASSHMDIHRPTDNGNLAAKFSAYHLSEKKVKGSPWDEELYSKDIESEICNVLSSVSRNVQKGKITQYVYTMGKDYKAVLLGAITVFWYDFWDHADPQYDWEWDYQEEYDIGEVDEQYIVQEASDPLSPKINLLKRNKLLTDPMLNYDNLLMYYRSKLFHKRLNKQQWTALYSELENVRDYLKTVINGNSENDTRMKYEAKKALAEVNGFLSYMDDMAPAMESFGEYLDAVTETKEYSTKLDKNGIIKELNKFAKMYPKEKWVVAFKAALVLYGVFSETNDIDVFAEDDVVKSLIKRGYYHEDAPYGGERITVTDRLEVFEIQDSKPSQQIEGFNVADIDDIYAFYKRMNRPKDKETLRRIESYKRYGTVVSESVQIFQEGDFDDCVEYADLNSIKEEFQPTLENILISKDNLEINLDQWKPGTPLWITGTSGDGKSTLALKYAKEYSATVFHTDLILVRVAKSKEKFEKFVYGGHKNQAHPLNDNGMEYVNAHPEIPYNLGYSSETDKYVLDFMKWIIEVCKINPKYNRKLVVVEGSDIGLLGAEFLSQQPLIILGCSRVHAALRRINREHKEGTPYLSALVKIISRYGSVVKRLDDNKERLWSDVTALHSMESTALMEGDVSHLDGNYVGKEKFNLSEYRTVPIGKEVLKKYKARYPFLKHIRENDGGVIWFDGDNIVGVLGAAPHKETVDQNQVWIHSFEISKDYQKHGLARQMLDYGIHKLGARYLTVAKKNEVAIELYKKVGFVNYGENKSQWFMKLKGAPTPEFVPVTESTTMNSSVWRVTYDGVGIYEAYRVHCNDSDWYRFKNSSAAKWLPVPPNYTDHTHRHRSYFTYDGMQMFKRETLPVIKRALDPDKIRITEIYQLPQGSRVVYHDKYQIVISYDGDVLFETSFDHGKTLYHLSKKNLSGSVVEPSVPDNYMTQNGYEDNTTKRVCFCRSIQHCIGALSRNCKGERYYVFTPDKMYVEHETQCDDPSKPRYVPDTGWTHEVWIEEPVRMKLLGEIEVIDVNTRARTHRYDYDYGKKHAELYEWKWRWIWNIDKTLGNRNAVVPVSEGTIVTKEDIRHNLNKWKPGVNSNVLLVTGLSGSGKTTTGYEMAYDYKAEVFQLDWIENPDRMQDSPETPNYGLWQYIKKMHYKAMKNCHKLYNEDWRGFVTSIFESILRFAKMNPDKLFIVEGIQIPGCLYNFPHIEDFPIIIKGTSVVSSMIRRFKRDGIRDAFRTGGDNILKYYAESEKRMEWFRKHITDSESAVVESTVSNITFGKSETDILSIIKTMTPTEQLYLGTPGGKRYNWSRSEFYQEVLYVAGVPVAFLVVSEIPANKGVGHMIIGTRAGNQYRHKGYATTLINRFLNSDSIPNHIKQLEWGFDEGNSKSEKLAEKFGFKNPIVSEDQLHHRGYVMTQNLSDIKPITEATYIEATKDEDSYFPVFVFLSYTGTNMAKLIKAFTHDPYAHSSLSFDTNLDNMVSFNRDGMVVENIHKNIFKKNAPNIRYSLYMYLATAAEYDAMKNFVDELLGRRSKLRYNVLGLTNFIFGRGSAREDRYFCSEFIAATISAGNDKIFDRQPYMISPYYFAKNKNFIFIKTGILKNYDQKVVDKLVAEKLEEGGFTDVIVK